MKFHESKGSVVMHTATKEGIPCDNGPNGHTAAATARHKFNNNYKKAQIRHGNMTRPRSRSISAWTEISNYNGTDNGPCNTDLDQIFWCGATRTTRNEDVPCDNGPVGDCTYAVAATAADQTELNPVLNQQQTAQVLLLPRKVTRWRSTRTRSNSSAATLTEIDKADVTDNGPCKPDLEACCQNISALLAACAAKNNTNGKYWVPTEGFVYGYMRVLIALLQLEPECCVYSYIYIKRLQNGTGLKIGAGNWEKLLIVTLLLASKFVDDMTMKNKDFAFALNDWSLKKINRLESVMLQALRWDIYVPISEYTRNYFELIQQPTNPTTILDWQVDADAIKQYFNVGQNQYYQFIFHGLNLQHIPAYK